MDDPKQIDLDKNAYRKQLGGRWHLPDNPKVSRNFFFVMLGVLAVLFFNRDQFQNSAILFGITAMVAAVAGIMFANWLKDVY